MVKRSAYAMAGGELTPAVAPRLRTAQSVSCSWLIGTGLTPAVNTQMFADVPNHRTRRLSECSP